METDLDEREKKEIRICKKEYETENRKRNGNMMELCKDYIIQCYAKIILSKWDERKLWNQYGINER